MSRPLIQQLIHSLKDFPAYKKDTDNLLFWDIFDSDEYKLAVNFLVVSKAVSLTGINLETLPAESKNATLGYFQACGELLSMKQFITEKLEASEEKQEKNPLDNPEN